MSDTLLVIQSLVEVMKDEVPYGYLVSVRASCKVKLTEGIKTMVNYLIDVNYSCRCPLIIKLAPLKRHSIRFIRTRQAHAPFISGKRT